MEITWSPGKQTFNPVEGDNFSFIIESLSAEDFGAVNVMRFRLLKDESDVLTMSDTDFHKQVFKAGVKSVENLSLNGKPILTADEYLDALKTAPIEFRRWMIEAANRIVSISSLPPAEKKTDEKGETRIVEGEVAKNL